MPRSRNAGTTTRRSGDGMRRRSPEMRPGRLGVELQPFGTLRLAPPLVVTSRLADDYLWSEVLNLGGWDVLAKPFRQQEVLYVLDSACAFTKGLKKPISAECATACAKAGSPLVILTDSGTIYWPIADTTPSSGQNDRLLPFAGQKVSITGKVLTKGGSRALIIEKIEAASTK